MTTTKTQLTKEEKVKIILDVLRHGKLKSKTIADLTEHLIIIYYLTSNWKPTTKLQIAEMILSWESDYADYNTKEELVEMVESLYEEE